MKSNLLGLKVTFSRWPWQGYGWFKPPKDAPRAPLNPNGARFGGGWGWKLGIAVGGRTVLLDLLFGSIRIERWSQAEEDQRAEDRKRLEEAISRRERDKAAEDGIPF